MLVVCELFNHLCISRQSQLPIPIKFLLQYIVDTKADTDKNTNCVAATLNPYFLPYSTHYIGGLEMKSNLSSVCPRLSKLASTKTKNTLNLYSIMANSSPRALICSKIEAFSSSKYCPKCVIRSSNFSSFSIDCSLFCWRISRNFIFVSNSCSSNHYTYRRKIAYASIYRFVITIENIQCKDYC